MSSFCGNFPVLINSWWCEVWSCRKRGKKQLPDEPVCFQSTKSIQLDASCCREFDISLCGFMWIRRRCSSLLHDSHSAKYRRQLLRHPSSLLHQECAGRRLPATVNCYKRLIIQVREHCHGWALHCFFFFVFRRFCFGGGLWFWELLHALKWSILVRLWNLCAPAGSSFF